jgi:peptide deformylase
MWRLQMLLHLLLLSDHNEGWANFDRRMFGGQLLAISAAAWTIPSIASEKEIQAHFRYADDWIGTQLGLRSLNDSVQLSNWPMGRWPDPILRRPATPVDPLWYGSTTLETATTLLKQTARREGAVGLAAQQCGVDARIVFVEGRGILVNPHIVARSPETEMRVWKERCLVLPPTFVGTVLRDSWVDVEFWTVMGKLQRMRLSGEMSRCVQHEMGTYSKLFLFKTTLLRGWHADRFVCFLVRVDHDRGILILDHVDLDEMENNIMRAIEADGHTSRMLVAYSRQVDSAFLAAQRISRAQNHS